MSTDVVLIPPEGLVEVFYPENAEGEEIDQWQILDDRVPGGGRSLVHIHTSTGEVEVRFTGDPTAMVNPRAREAVAMLTGVHMVFTGPVILSQITPEKVYEVVSALSRRIE